MFTGLIEEVGHVTESVDIDGGRRLRIAIRTIADDLKIGDSISVNGVCQTVVAFDGESFSCEAVGETLEKTTLGRLEAGVPVNLERSLRADARLGGHMVQGHVSGVAEIRSVEQRGENWLLLIELPEQLMPLVVPEGSIAVDGVSLTVASIQRCEIGINIVPHTAKHTNLVSFDPGDKVNIETDILGRYVARMLTAWTNSAGRLDVEQLTKWGYA